MRAASHDRYGIRALALAALVALAPAPAAAQGNRAQGAAATELISRDEAAERARASAGGRVLGVRLERKGRPRYRVRLLLDGGRVRTVTVDASSGAVD